jgi:hypothetical protein
MGAASAKAANATIPSRRRRGDVVSLNLSWDFVAEMEAAPENGRPVSPHEQTLQRRSAKSNEISLFLNVTVVGPTSEFWLIRLR